MRAFIGSLVILAVITAGAAFILGAVDMSSESVYSTSSTRH